MCVCSPEAHELQSELKTKHLVKEKGQYAPGTLVMAAQGIVKAL